MKEMNTATILRYTEGTEDSHAIKPTLFVCYGLTISEFRLQGKQVMGRPTSSSIPDIPVHARFMSRDHGFFDTEGLTTCYTAVETTNGIRYKGTTLQPGTRIQLNDGDEIMVPGTEDGGKDKSGILVYASTAARLRM